MGILYEPYLPGGGAAIAQGPDLLAVNTVLGDIKTSLPSTYQAFGFRTYAHRYLGQVQYLFNRANGCFQAAFCPSVRAPDLAAERPA